jgi:hypothetical protein
VGSIIIARRTTPVGIARNFLPAFFSKKDAFFSLGKKNKTVEKKKKPAGYFVTHHATRQ